MQTNFQRNKHLIAKYKITPQTIHNIENVPRLNPLNVDCVVNAMEIIGILSPQEAGLVRANIGQSGGIHPEHFLEKFREVNPEYNFRFEQISINELNDWTNSIEMQPLTMIFCGYRDYNNVGHVYIIAKDFNNYKFLLDPQLNPPICNLTNDNCFAYIAGKQSYFILVRENLPMNIDEEEKEEEEDVVMNRIYTRRSKSKSKPRRSKPKRSYKKTTRR